MSRTILPFVLATTFAFQVQQTACGGSPSPSTPATPGAEVLTASDGTRFSLESVVTGLEVPWSLAFAPDGRLFVTERPGRVRIVQNGVLLADPALTLDDVSDGRGSPVSGDDRIIRIVAPR